MLPGNPMGGPAGPGATPMTAPGAGAGNEAATDGLIAGIMPTLLKALQAYPLGSKKGQAVLNAYRALSTNFNENKQTSLAQPALQQLAMNAANKGPMGGAPMPPLSVAAPPGAPEGGGAEAPM